MTGRRASTKEHRRPPLSVVVVTYNEEDGIRECIESVFAACEPVCDFEVLLVDSNSTDRTVERAAEYPVSIYRITSDDVTTPAAGRYVGAQHARGECILFVDGDMVLTETWLPNAMEHIREEGVAAVDGHLNSPAEDDAVRGVDSVRGVALYDAAALRSVGGFDPQLKSVEDIHLGYELTTAGYRLVRLPQVAANHPAGDGLTEPLRRWRRGYARGTGQAVRKSIRSPRLVGKHVYRIRHRLVMTAWLAVGVIALAATPAFLAWLALSAVGVGYVVSELGVVGAATFCLQKGLSTVGLVLGLSERPRPRESFPLESVEELTRAPVHDGGTPVARR